MPEPEPRKPPFEVTPALVLGCVGGMFLWLLLAGILMMALKLGAGSL